MEVSLKLFNYLFVSEVIYCVVLTCGLSSVGVGVAVIELFIIIIC